MKEINIFNFVKLKGLPSWVKEKKIEGKNILVVSPHSDDISVSCGATVFFLSKKNRILPVLFFKGSEDKKMVKKREKEMKKESKVLGIEKPVFLRLNSHDEKSSFSKTEIFLVKEFFRKYNPDIVFLPKKDDPHPRHRLATEITLDVLEKSSLFFYETPWSLFGNMEFNLISVFNKKAFSKKLKSIKRHSSQLKRIPLDKMAENLLELRRLIVPEQRIKGYGEKVEEFSDHFMECFIYENNN